METLCGRGRRQPPGPQGVQVRRTRHHAKGNTAHSCSGASSKRAKAFQPSDKRIAKPVCTTACRQPRSRMNPPRQNPCDVPSVRFRKATATATRNKPRGPTRKPGEEHRPSLDPCCQDSPRCPPTPATPANRRPTRRPAAPKRGELSTPIPGRPAERADRTAALRNSRPEKPGPPLPGNTRWRAGLDRPHAGKTRKRPPQPAKMPSCQQPLSSPSPAGPSSPSGLRSCTPSGRHTRIAACGRPETPRPKTQHCWQANGSHRHLHHLAVSPPYHPAARQVNCISAGRPRVRCAGPAKGPSAWPVVAWRKDVQGRSTSDSCQPWG